MRTTGRFRNLQARDRGHSSGTLQASFNLVFGCRALMHQPDPEATARPLGQRRRPWSRSTCSPRRSPNRAARRSSERGSC
jgi:hypothetical protein